MKKAFSRFQELPIYLLVTKGWLDSEMRISLNQLKVKQYAAEMKSGCKFPLPVVFASDEEPYHVGDGFHRIKAYELNGVNKIEVDVRPGSLKEAILHNIKANQEAQGLPFGRGDKTKAVKVLLTRPEFAGMMRKEIAETVGTFTAVVARVAKQLGLPPVSRGGGLPRVDPQEIIDRVLAGKTRQEIMEELGISMSTFYRADIRCQFQDCPHCQGTGKVLKRD